MLVFSKEEKIIQVCHVQCMKTSDGCLSMKLGLDCILDLGPAAHN